MAGPVDTAHKSGAEGKPLNAKLWHSITLMARAKFAKYPSPAAAHWVHTQYALKGGQFSKPNTGKR